MMKSSSMHDHYCPQFLLSLWWSLRRHRSAVNSFKSINTSIEETCRGLPLPFPFRLANREIFHMFASTKLAVFPVFVGRGFSDQKDIFLCHIHCKKELIALPAPHTHITISQTYKFRKLKKKLIILAKFYIYHFHSGRSCPKSSWTPCQSFPLCLLVFSRLLILLLPFSIMVIRLLAYLVDFYSRRATA